MKSQDVPKLRFPEFSQGWKKITLGNKTSKVGSGVTPKGGSQVYTDDGVLFIRSQNVENNTLSLDDITFIPEEIHQKMDGSQVEPFDILLNITGASIGRSCVVPERIEEANVNQHVCIIRLKENNEPRFYQSVLASEKGDQLIYKHQAGGGREGLNFANIRSFRFHVPDFKEQQKIADFLSSVDQKIQQLRRKKELLEEYKKGVMQKLFPSTEGQVPEIRFKDENGEDFPDWEIKKLQDVAEVNPRSGDLPESFIYIDLESVEDGRLLKEEKVTLSEAPSRAQRLLEPGDILFQTVRPYQMNNYLFDNEGNYVASSGYAQIKAKQNRQFLFYLLHYQPIVNLVIRWSTGSSFPAISANDLVDLPLPIPSEKEQQKIADVLNLLSKKIHSIESKIEKFQVFKKGLLQQMFV